MKNDNTVWQLEQMATEELDRLLHRELEKEAPDGETVRLLLRILEEREEAFPTEQTAQAEEAWEEYLKPVKQAKRRRGWLWKAGAMAAVLAVAVTVLARPAKAGSFFERLAQWTDSFFQLLSPGDKSRGKEDYIFTTDNPGLQEIYDTVTSLGFTEPVVPMWLPEGYELVECKIDASQSCKTVTAEMNSLSGCFLFKASIYTENVAYKYYKDNKQIVTREIKGTVFNIMENNGSWTVVWVKENVECSMLLDCREDTLYRILESIYTAEET